MSFFDSVKKSLGISKDKPAEQGRAGRIYDQFEITFVEEKLGIGISKYTGDMLHLDSSPNNEEELSCPVVTNFENRAYDVQPGDLIVALEGNPISSFDDFKSIIAAIGRPVRIRFLRRCKQEGPASGSGGNKPPTVNKSPSTGTGNTMSTSIFRNFGGMHMGGTTSKAPTPAPVVLSEDEKALRRERLSAAAQDRSKSWDKKLGQKKPSQSLNKPIVDGNAVEAAAGGFNNNNTTHEDTERAIRKTKELEVRIEQQMGYNPFKPHMSFAAGGGDVEGGPSPSPVDKGEGQARNLTLALDQDQELNLQTSAVAEAEEATVAEVDDAFAMLLSLSESEQERGRVAVSTVSRMIQNLAAAAPEDLRLRSIRVSNKAFQSKVAAVPGGAELLVAAGYTYRTCSTINSGGTGTGTANSGSVAEEAVQGNGEGHGEGELFLVHDMDAGGRGKLHYTLSRIQELLESVSGAASPVTPKRN